MSKRQKVKRYGNIYGRTAVSGSWLIVLAMIVGVLLFALIGWSLYTPIHHFIMNFGEERTPSSEGTSASFLAEEPSASLPPSSQPTAARPAFAGGLYVPVSAVGNQQVFDNLLSQAKGAGLSAVLIDAKDATGTVLFDSDNPTALEAKAIDPAAFDASKVAAQIEAQGLTPVARIHAFRDSVASGAVREMAVHYYDTETVWLDNSPELGGKTWLNPYSEQARGYLISLAEELAGKGFSHVVIDSVQFPSGVGLEKAGYGDNITLSRSEQLQAFLADLQMAVEAKGGSSAVCLSWESVEQGDDAANTSIYGGSPIALASEHAVLSVPASVETINSALGQVRQASPDTAWSVLIRAYAADGTMTDVSDVIEASKQDQASGYFLYHPQGNYILE